MAFSSSSQPIRIENVENIPRALIHKEEGRTSENHPRFYEGWDLKLINEGYRADDHRKFPIIEPKKKTRDSVCIERKSPGILVFPDLHNAFGWFDLKASDEELPPRIKWDTHSQIPGFEILCSGSKQRPEKDQVSCFVWPQNITRDVDDLTNRYVNARIRHSGDKEAAELINVLAHHLGEQRQGPLIAKALEEKDTTILLAEFNLHEDDKCNLVWKNMDMTAEELAEEAAKPPGRRDLMLAWALKTSRNFYVLQKFSGPGASAAVQDFCEYMGACFHMSGTIGPLWHYSIQRPASDINSMEFDFNRCQPPSWMASGFEVTVQGQALAKGGTPISARISAMGSFSATKEYPNPATMANVYKLGITREHHAVMDFYRRLVAEKQEGARNSIRAEVRRHQENPALYALGFEVMSIEQRRTLNALVPPAGTKFKAFIATPTGKVQLDGRVVPDYLSIQRHFTGLARGNPRTQLEDGQVYDCVVEFVDDLTSLKRHLAALSELQAPLEVRTSGVDLSSVVFRSPANRNLDGVNLLEQMSVEQRVHFNTTLTRCGLNTNQMTDAKSTIHANNGLVLLQSPPGTGKTITNMATVAALLEAGITVLVTSPSNKGIEQAVDSFKKILGSAQISPSKHSFVLFKGAYSRLSRLEAEETEKRHALRPAQNMLDNMTPEELAEWNVERQWWDLLMEEDIRANQVRYHEDAFNVRFKAKINKWASDYGHAMYEFANQRLEVTQQIRYASKDKKVELRERRDELELTLLKAYMHDVKLVFATCSMSAHEILVRLFHPTVIIIEEAGQGTLPDLITPLAANRESVHTVKITGDHKQLQPVVLSERVNEAVDALKNSLFRDLWESADKKGFTRNMLTTQYRMHPHISSWVSRTFYGGLLQDDPSTSLRDLPLQRTLGAFWKQLPSWNGRFRVAINVGGASIASERFERTASIWNRSELDVCMRLIEDMLGFTHPATGRPIRVEDIAVLTPYKGQVYSFRRVDRNGIPIQSTSGMQGGEALITIVMFVRNLATNPEDVGFIHQGEMLNVSDCTDLEVLFCQTQKC